MASGSKMLPRAVLWIDCVIRGPVLLAAVGILVLGVVARPATAQPPAAAIRLQLTPTGAAASD